MKMKRLVLLFMMLGFLTFMNPQQVFSQNIDALELSDDTISIDQMDPQFYEAEQEENGGNTATIAIIIGVVVVFGGAAFFLMKKKK